MSLAFYGINQTAAMLNVPRNWFAAEVKAGRIPCFRIANKYMFDPAEAHDAILVRTKEMAVDDIPMAVAARERLMDYHRRRRAEKAV